MMDISDRLLADGMAGAAGGGSGVEAAIPYHPPTISAKRLALCNSLSQRRPPVALTLGDAVVAFAPAGLGIIDELAPPAARMLFWFTIDGRPLVLQMAKGLYERLLARIDPELLAADIDREILPLLLESCIQDALTEAETRLQGRIELVAVQRGSAFDLDGLDVALEITVDGETAGMASLRAGDDDVLRLAELFAARSKPPRSYGDLVVELSLRPGSIWLDLGALKRLKTGDVLLAEEDATRWDRLAATTGEGWLFPVEMTRKGPTVRARFRRADSRDQEEWMMVESNQADDDDALTGPPPSRTESAAKPEPEAAAADLESGPAAPPADAAFDDLPIKLVFEIGRLELPLGQLQEIGPGHVFDLKRPLGDAVEIHAGGRRIGQGEILRIEDQIGVRVVRLFGQSGA